MGWPTDIESWTMENLKAYFATGYSPSNGPSTACGLSFAEADNYVMVIIGEGERDRRAGTKVWNGGMKKIGDAGY